MGRKKAEDDARACTHYTSYLQVLATDIPFTSPSVLLFFDKQRYLFNAGEGLQRIFREFKLRISKVDNILFTRISTETLAGLPGMLLSTDASNTASDLLGTKINFTVHGPPGIAQYTDSFRSYVNKNHGYKVQEFGLTGSTTLAPIVKSNVVTITPVAIRVHTSATAAAAPAGSGTTGAAAAPQAAQEAAAAAAASAEADMGVAAAGTSTSGAPAANPSLKRPADAIASSRGEAASTTGGDMLADAAAHEAGLQKAEGPVKKARGEASSPKAIAGGAQLPVPPTAGRSPPRAAASTPQPSMQASVCYVCELAGRPGKFDPKKAEELGIPMGPLYGELVRGKPVPNRSGRLVQPEEVMEPGQPGTLMVVVDIPSERHLATAVEEQPFRKWSQEEASTSGGGADTSGSSGSGSSRQLRIMVHLGSAALVQGSTAYRAWMDSLAAPGGGGWQHMVVSCGAHQASPIPRATALQVYLNCLSDSVFPLLHSHLRPQLPKDDVAATSSSTSSVTVVPSLLQYNLTQTTKKQSGVSSSPLTDEAPLDAAASAAEFRARHPSIVAMASGGSTEAGEAEADVPGVLKGIERDAAEVLFLGTASSQPGKFRNVTGIYLDLFASGGMLVDCGEDSLGQLVRRYGEADTLRRMLALQAVWVSHMHADHHNGLYRILELRHQHLGAGAPPLPIIGPFPLLKVLVAFSKVLPLSYVFIPNQHFHSVASGTATRPLPTAASAAFTRLCAAMHLKRLEPFEVEHVAHSSGLIVEGQAGWKIVFSADTRPCEQVVRAARDATLLIHEATFEDEMQAEAEAKKHSTTSEALKVATEAGVYRTVLTHFSTRYPTLPQMPPNPSMAVAMDFMVVNLADLRWLPRLVAPLGALFEAQKETWKAEAEDGGEEEAA